MEHLVRQGRVALERYHRLDGGEQVHRVPSSAAIHQRRGSVYQRKGVNSPAEVHRVPSSAAIHQRKGSIHQRRCTEYPALRQFTSGGGQFTSGG
eukprot:7615539-Pyramimonas_sp.AAC.1